MIVVYGIKEQLNQVKEQLSDVMDLKYKVNV